MEQEITFILQIILFGLTALTGLAILIFVLRKKDVFSLDWETFERTVKLIHDQTDENIDAISKMNKKKDKIKETIQKIDKDTLKNFYLNHTYQETLNHFNLTPYKLSKLLKLYNIFKYTK